ncbi:MAG: hypothetical protein ACK575_07065 [Cyanobacteriota bacterium]
MARRSDLLEPYPANRPAAPWALFWLGAVASGLWLPLLVSESVPWPRQPRTMGSPTLVAQPPGPPTPISLLARLPQTPPPSMGSPNLPAAPPLNERERLRQPISMASENLESSAALRQQDPEGPAVTPALSGALQLGGPLGLETLKEKAMVHAARLEQLVRARSADRLFAVPPHWRPAMRALLHGQQRVLPAEVVRVPAPHLKTAEEYPMALKPDGVAETTVTPPAHSREALERWAERQAPNPEGSVRPVMVVLEPLGPEPEPPASKQRAEQTESRPEQPPSIHGATVPSRLEGGV